MYYEVMEHFKISYSNKPEAFRAIPLETGNYLVTGAIGKIGGEICKYLASNTESTVYAGTKNLTRFSSSELSQYSNVKPLLLGENEFIRADKFFTPELEVKGVVHCEGSYGELGELANIDLDLWIENLSIYLKRTISMINWMASGTQISQVSSIFLGGGGASEAYVGLSNYSVMKSSLVRLIETAAQEISINKLTLNALGPGPTNSQMVDQVIGSDRVIDQRIVDASISLHASSKGISERVFRAIDFLFSEEGRKLSGLFLSAEWDDFNRLGVKENNSYKLRRVIPID
jgi:NAD(P)-dependent dehydrogenase (short-subunit alcohol dehydrogenase family)